MLALALALGVIAAPMLATPAAAQRAWIKDELRLNLRTGPGVQYRIMGRIKTGDTVEILERGDGWTQIRLPELGDGWIPEGYLQPSPPASLRLSQSESQTEEFRTQVEELSRRSSELSEQNAELVERDEAQRTQIQRLTGENLELRAGARWPHWIAGAGILTFGMLLGVILRAMSSRRSRPRIRL